MCVLVSVGGRRLNLGFKIKVIFRKGGLSMWTRVRVYNRCVLNPQMNVRFCKCCDYFLTCKTFMNVSRKSCTVWVHLNVKAIPLQALTGPEGYRSLRLPDFKTIGTSRWQGCQPYAPAALTPRKYSWYSFLLEAESTPGP
jgi:hypothetical protein